MGARPGGTVALPLLALLAIGACGGGSEPLTTQEYADALEEAHAERQEKLAENADAYEDLPEELEERVDALGAPSSAEDAETAKEIAETAIQAITNIVEGALMVSEDYYHDVSGLRPPAHLSDLHHAMTGSLEQVLLKWDELVEALKDRSEATTLEEDHDEFSKLASRASEACEELRAKLEEELGRDVAICD